MDDLVSAISSSHLATASAEMWFGDTDLGELPISTGSVSIDATRAILRTCSLTVSPDSSRPLSEFYDLLSAYGVEVRLFRGVSGTLIPLGVFLVTDLDYDEAGMSLTLNGSDRSLRISRARLVDPYTIAAGTDLAQALTDLLHDRWGACPVAFTATDTGAATVPAQVVLDVGESSDPWAGAQALAQAAGFNLYFDTNGLARLRIPPDLARTQADYTYSGGEAAVVIASTVHLSYDKTYTGVVASGEGTGVATPLRSVVWDTDPSSPTYYLGPAGMVPYFYSSPLLTTQASCDAAAATLLSSVTGKSEQVGWTQVVNPMHDAWDVVDITHPDGSVHRYLLDQITMPLSAADPMSATARETQVV
jgi:hypothetical protein